MVQMFSCYGALHASNLNEISTVCWKQVSWLDEKVYTCVRKPSRSLWLAIRIFKVGFHMKKTVACMTGALWAKRGEHDISCGARHECEARDEGKGKIKLYLLLLYCFFAFTFALFFSFPRVALHTCVALHAKYRVHPAWLIEHLSCRLWKLWVNLSMYIILHQCHPAVPLHWLTRKTFFWPIRSRQFKPSWNWFSKTKCPGRCCSGLCSKLPSSWTFYRPG